MIASQGLDQLIATDPVGEMQAAIVACLKGLLPGVSVVTHPGKVDLSELVAKTVVQSPGIGVGWSRMRAIGLADGSFNIIVDWVAYIVAEAKQIASKRVEKEAVALAIGARLLAVLGDVDTSNWGLKGVLPPETASPAPEAKPLFTVKDASQGTAYYTVTWTQVLADRGAGDFPQPIGRSNPDNGTIDYQAEALLRSMAPWIPAMEVAPDD